MKTEIKTANNTYKIVNFKRKDNLFNTYIEKFGNLSGVYKGEYTYSIGSKTENFPQLEEFINSKYEIY